MATKRSLKKWISILSVSIGITQSQGTYQISMSTSRPCFTKRDIFWGGGGDEQYVWVEGQAYKNMVHCKWSK